MNMQGLNAGINDSIVGYCEFWGGIRAEMAYHGQVYMLRALPSPFSATFSYTATSDVSPPLGGTPNRHANENFQSSMVNRLPRTRS